ncbi:MAG TPA: hypothetical protein PKH96_20280, partial [Gemmatimonadaceae bacterium]|nr:hypothetical protein [Gemmatimonadaceae bacterium]
APAPAGAAPGARQAMAKRSGGAIAVMSRGARTGLAALADAPPALGGAGHAFAIAAVVLSALSAALLTESFSAARDA